MKYGVRTGSDFTVRKNGKKVNNLYAAGLVLNGHNTVKSADGEGVSLLTGLQVAENILKK
jgi:glycerol-3-phosphate dehydrogenase subunit B